MPPARKASGTQAAGPGKQSKLSFAHRVTKPSATRAAGKDLISATSPSPLSKQVFPDRTPAAPEPAREVVDVHVEDAADEEDEDEAQFTTAPAPVPAKSAAQLEAEKVSDAQVGRYWRTLEAQRLAPRVHQHDLDVSEKVLRYFDVSSQYGPCIGISRMKRWTRAEKLGLNPPVEVLAVLLKQEKAGNDGIERRAHMDALLNPSANDSEVA